MTTAFFQSATGDPVKSQRRIGWQTADGLPATTFVDFLHNGGPVRVAPSVIERAIIRSTPMRQAPIDSKGDVEVGPLNMGDLDVGNQAQLMLLLSVLGKYATTNPSGAHYRHRLSQDKANAQTAKLTMQSDSDKGIPLQIVDLLASGFEINATARQNLLLTVPCVGGKYDFFGAATVTGTGVVAPRLRHSWDGHWEPTADKDVYVKIISDTATTVTFQVQIAAAGGYSASQVATKGVWTYVNYGASDLLLGTRAEQIQVYFPTGADGTYVDLDVWKILNRRAVWSPSFGTERVLAETQARFYFDDAEFAVDNGVQIAVAVPGVETRYGTGGTQPTGTFRKGFQDVSVRISRKYVDLTLEKALMTHDSVSLVLEAYSDTLIGATAQRYGATIVLPNLRLTGVPFDVEAGGQNQDEEFTFLAKESIATYTYNGLDYTADIEITVDTDIAAIV